ncbi:transglutaminase domain-containing protein [Maribacter sp. 2304DJ31-5]|uniref:transglutaminase domain-containing protein n=1 Tax=Maribacter sp. 2304DJ31-5 TaxID=3386273 RepID=UPI0039BD4FAA
MKRVLWLLLSVHALSFGQRSDFGHISFKKADSIALSYKGESLKNLPVLTHKLTVNLSTGVEKFRAIYTWVCTNIENDYDAYLKTKKKRKKLAENREAFLQWNNGFTPKVFKKLRSQRKTACTGYAYLIREMANLANINCKIIDGFGRTATLSLNTGSLPNHSWNTVKLNGKWYLCDATWSAGSVIFEKDGPVFKSEYFDGYFLGEPALFVKNHYPLKKEWILLPEPPTFNQFLEGPIIYKEAFCSNIIPMAPIQMRFETVRNVPIPFKFNVPDTSSAKNIHLLLNNGSSDKTVRPEVTRHQEEYIFQHSFDKAGLYDLHILVNDTIIATYVVRVKRKRK